MNGGEEMHYLIVDVPAEPRAWVLTSNVETTVVLPIRIESVANLRESWQARHRRAKAHRLAALAVPAHPLPCVVTLTRVGPRALDDDNLQGGFKALRDGVAARLGVDDADPRVTWKYGQRKGKPKEYAAIVGITPA